MPARVVQLAQMSYDPMVRIGKLNRLRCVKNLSDERAHLTRRFATLVMVLLDSRAHPLHQHA